MNLAEVDSQRKNPFDFFIEHYKHDKHFYVLCNIGQTAVKTGLCQSMASKSSKLGLRSISPVLFLQCEACVFHVDNILHHSMK